MTELPDGVLPRDHDPDGDGWARQVRPHVQYLQSLIEIGKIRAAGPVTGFKKRAGSIIMTVDKRAEVEQLVAADPLSVEDLIDELTILDPTFHPASLAAA